MLHEALLGDLRYGENGDIILRWPNSNDIDSYSERSTSEPPQKKRKQNHGPDEIQVLDPHTSLTFLQQLLEKDPQKRLTVDEALRHEFFAEQTTMRNLFQNRSLVDSNRKLETVDSYLRECLSSKRQQQQDTIRETLTISRNNVVSEFLSFFGRHYQERNAIYKHMHVVFDGETGIDAGGLTSELFSLFFEQLQEASDLFDVQQETQLCLPADTVANNDSSRLLRNLDTYTVVGRIIAKCFLERRPLLLKLPNWFYRFLLGMEPRSLKEWMSDSRQFDSSFVHGLEFLLTYSDPESIVEETFPIGNEQVSVTRQNLQQYVLFKLRQKLEGENGKRLERMTALKEGFCSMLDDHLLKHLLPQLNSNELAVLLCGPSYIDADIIIRDLKFVNWPRNSPIPAFFERVLREIDIKSLKRFLQWTVAMPNVPLGGLQRKITITKSLRTFAHTCSYTLELRSDIDDYDTFKEHLTQMLAASVYATLEE